MKQHIACAVLAAHGAAGLAQTSKLDLVTIQGAAPSSLPSNIPTTRESLTGEDIARQINATDSEDALKYFPSLLVRKRYIGDYNHAILSSRASGTGNSARSAVYADGILLSNYLGNGVGGLAFPPRWGLVTPEEIERVDVMYGPFSAAYPGNSVGAVVDYQTRMPTRFEAHAKAGYTTQNFSLYGHAERQNAWQASASVGDRADALVVDQRQPHGQRRPSLTFITRTAAPAGSTGAMAGLNSAGQPWWLIGAGTQYDTQQDHLKIKLAYELSPTLRASYVFGAWRNEAAGRSTSWLRDAQGLPVTASDFTQTDEDLRHAMHGFSLKQRTGGEWDWELAASLYDYARDTKQTLPANTLADGSGTGWNTLALKGIHRARGHVQDFGLQQDHYRLRFTTSNANGSLASAVRGETVLQSAFVQDAWLIAPDWKAVLGLRAERWEARDGRTDFSASSGTSFAARREHALSPKAAVSWQAGGDSVLKASLGRAVRMPTVAELYGATATANSQYINDPNLKPEKSWTGELSLEQGLGAAQARITLFAESTRDSIYSQTLFDAAANRNISRVQNVDRIGTTGLEATLATADWLLRGLDLSMSATYTDSKIKANTGFVAAPGDTLGKWQPNIPRWRATAAASYRVNEQWSATLAGRYSGRQYRTLNNADVNGFSYMGVSKYASADVRVVWRPTKQWTAAFGIDNLNDYQYWNFHPYPQRSYSAELRYDL